MGLRQTETGSKAQDRSQDDSVRDSLTQVPSLSTSLPQTLAHQKHVENSKQPAFSSG